jgi:hypothetical protein
MMAKDPRGIGLLVSLAVIVILAGFLQADNVDIDFGGCPDDFVKLFILIAFLVAMQVKGEDFEPGTAGGIVPKLENIVNNYV